MPDNKAASETDANANNNQSDPSSDGPAAANAVADAADDTLGADAQPEAVQSEVESAEVALQRELDAVQERADRNQDAMLRTQAEMENLRKRQRRELENAHKFALDKIAMELLPVCDTLELGVVAASEEQADIAKILEGSNLTLKMLTQALEKFNIVEVNPVEEKFDPDLHQAISMQEGTDAEPNTVLSVLQKGYTLNERLLRPAMVIIAK